mmetsp:Transcript_57379/g.124714  ORF Transcript_57379/g.124714 Transcript_57379/m.124714 type:complete len:428 (+) Transcript_57379:1-1284(+)
MRVLVKMPAGVLGFNPTPAAGAAPAVSAAGGAAMPQPHGGSYRLASHIVTLSRKDGTAVKTDSFASLSKRVCPTTPSSSFADSATPMPVKAGGEMAQHWESRSFDAAGDPQRLIAQLEDFAERGFKHRNKKFWTDNFDIFSALCDQVRLVAMHEPRCVPIRDPTYVLGDLHGNFEDLHSFSQALWRQGISICPANLLFLGDYVDRRPFSLEVIAYLFSLKLISPTKIVLLRGNHELRIVNRTNGFQAECIKKFGEQDGMSIWERVNSVFDCLPIAAIISESVFCVHGGIPASLCDPSCNPGSLISRINAIPVPLATDDADPVALELLWSDPQATDLQEDFVQNPERGCAHKFSGRALERFLSLHQLSMLIRAHEFKVHLGFQVQKRHQMVTVFSSSAYQGHSNEAACALVADGRVRLLRLESTAQKM